MINLWKQEYLLNLDEIDDQHKHFFTLCGEVVHLAETVTSDKKSIASVIRSLGALRTYAFLHFKTEEEIMLKYGFPEYLKHTGFHNGYLQKMMEFETGFKALLAGLKNDETDKQMFKAFLLEMSSFVADWWGVHIVSQDSKYALHLKQKKANDIG